MCKGTNNQASLYIMCEINNIHTNRAFLMQRTLLKSVILAAILEFQMSNQVNLI